MTISLNPEQRAAVSAVDGDWVIISGAGTGKTRVMVERYLRMVMNHGISQRDILNLTFTSEAAKNMVERVGLMDADKVFRTFHSFCLDLLKKERQYLPFETVPTIIPVRGEQFVLMKDLLKTYRTVTSYHSLAGRISEWKAGNVSVQQALDESYDARTMDYFYALAYRDYEARCRKEGWLDFDSLVKETVKLLESNEEVRNRWKRKYIAVDEAQDTDTTQAQLLRLLYDGNIFFVGDANQLIYEWRSAQASNLEMFTKDFKAKTLFLGTNYRSTTKLVEYFKSILPVDNGLASYMVSARWEGQRPRFIRYFHEDEEANETLTEIVDRDLIDTSAIIARTNRQLQLIQRRAMSRNIRAEIIGKKNVWQENEVKHLIDLTKEKVMDQRPAATVMQELIHSHKLVERYAGTNTNAMDKSPVENMNDITRMAGRKSKATGQPLSVVEFLEWLRKITHMRRSKTTPILTLSTVHQAKGREWKHVFVVGCDQGTMPHKDGELAEESRIFFVAASRAADELTISFSKNHSQFLNDVVEEIEIFGEEDDDNIENGEV